MAIFTEFGLHQAAVVEGLIAHEDGTGDLIEKGDAVMQYLVYLDVTTNFDIGGKRKLRYVHNSNGVPLADKLFKYKRDIVDNMPKWTIWRAQ